MLLLVEGLLYFGLWQPRCMQQHNQPEGPEKEGPAATGQCGRGGGPPVRLPFPMREAAFDGAHLQHPRSVHRP